MRENAGARASLWKKLVGWALVMVGLAGLLLPLLPGIPILVVGVLMLSTQHRWARVLVLWGRKKFPAIWPKRRKRWQSGERP